MPTDALRAFGLEATAREREINLTDRLADASDDITSILEEAIAPGILFTQVEALTAFYFEIIVA